MDYQFNEYEVQQNVLDFMQANGIYPADNLTLQLDGKVHRFRVDGQRKGHTAGVYRIFIDNCWPHGYVADYKHGLDYIPYYFPRNQLPDDSKRYFTDEKYKEYIAKSKKHQEELKAKEEEERAKAIIHAQDMYKTLPNAPLDFPYFVKKGVKLPTYDGENVSEIKFYKEINAVCIPLRDINGEIKSIQYIKPDGEKRFEYNAPVKGSFYSLNLSSLQYDDDNTSPIFIGEGVATMLTIYEAIGKEFQPVVAAMNCGNLLPVAKAIKEKYPEHKIFIIADNDHKSKINSGLNAANRACEELKLDGVIYPTFTKENNGTDFNDYASSLGLNAVKNLINSEMINVPLRKKQAEYAQYADNLGVLSHSSFADFCKPPQGKSWLIQDWIPRESLCMLFAPSGSCKGFVALDIAFAIACPYINKWHNFNVSQHGNVVYVTGEGQRGLRKRAAGIAHYKGMMTNEINMSFVTEAVPLDDKKTELGADKLIANIGAVCPNPDFIILDTVNCYMGGNENDTQDATRFINACKRIINEFHCTVFLVHHTGWALENRGRSRGSSVFHADLDMQYSLSKSGSTLTLQMAKTKDTDTQASLTFFLKAVPVPGFLKDDGSQETTCVLEYGDIVQDELSAPVEKISQGERFARDTYRQAAEEYGIVIRNKETGKENIAVSLEDWRKVFHERSSADTADTKRKAFQRARKILLEDKKLLFKKDFNNKEYYCVTSNTGSFEGEIFATVKRQRTAFLEY